MWLNTMFPFISFDVKLTKKAAKYENDLEFQNVFCNLLNIALYSFSFEGLPDTCNERYFKLCLILNGYAAIVNDNELGFRSLGVRPAAASYNVYGECSDVYAFGWNGFNKKYTNYMYGTDNTDVNAVVCRDNELMYPLVNVLLIVINKIS